MTDPAGASAALRQFVGPPSQEPVVRARDVIICPTFEYVPSIGLEEIRAHPPVAFNSSQLGGSSQAVAIGGGARIDRLSGGETNLVMNACTPRGHYFVPIRQFGQRYSFVRELDLEVVRDARSAWDSDAVLWDCLSLSRLVRDNAFSTQYAARILDYADGQQQIIYAIDPPARNVYRLRTDRDWLDEVEATALSRLVQSYWEVRDLMSPPLRRAMWRTEFSCWLAWADVALPIVVSGLESLLKTGDRRSTHQFKTRVPRLAEHVGVDGVSSELCREVYSGRSAWIHGAHVRLPSSGMAPEVPGRQTSAVDSEERDALRVVALFQDVLRSAIRRAIEDPETRGIFESDESVNSRWPV